MKKKSRFLREIAIPPKSTLPDFSELESDTESLLDVSVSLVPVTPRAQTKKSKVPTPPGCKAAKKKS